MKALRLLGTCAFLLAAASPASRAGGADLSVADMAARVVAYRGERFAAPVAAQTAAKDEIAAAGARAAERWTPPCARSVGAFVEGGKGIDFRSDAPPGAGVYYDALRHTLLAGPDVAGAGPAPLGLARELLRALEDQRFDLGKFRSGADLTIDEWLVRKSISDGEALRGAREITHTVASDLPEVLTGFYRGPVEAGARFVGIVEQAGGWAAVDGLYTEPPASMEQVLHPEKRASPADRPTRIDLPPIPELEDAGYRRAFETTLGESFLIGSLAPEDAIGAAIGWDGDRLRIYESKDGKDPVAVWALTFDSARDSRQFGLAWNRHRTSGSPAAAVRGEDAVIVFDGDAGRAAAVRDRAFGFTKRRAEGDTGHRGMDAVTSRRAEERLRTALETGEDPATGPGTDSEIVVTIVRTGEKTEFRVGDRTVTDPTELDRVIATLGAKVEGPRGRIRAEVQVPHRDVIRAIDAFMKAHITDITLEKLGN